MNALISIVALVAVLLAQRPAQTPARDARPSTPAAPATIRGRIFTDAGEPIRKARVGLAAEGHDEGWPTFTDAAGRFEFSGVAAGNYILTASKAGYVKTRYGARQPLEPPVPIKVDASATLDNVDIRLARGAAISGRIVDENGDPVIVATVGAERLVRSGGGLKTVTIKSTTTDDLGEYRLPELPSGSYVVVTDPTSALRDRMAAIAATGQGSGGIALADMSRIESLQQMYYPSAPSPAKAQVLSVQPGQELTAIDLTIRPVTLPTVSIVVADPGGRASRILYQLASDSQPVDLQTRRGLLRAGQPEAVPLLPGDWNLLVDGGEAGGAYSQFTVGESDMSIQVALKPLVRITGRIIVEGRARSDARIVLEASPRGFQARFLPNFSHLARVNPDGTFALDAVQGPIDIGLRNAPAGWTLQSIAVGGRQLPDTRLDITTGDPIADVALHVSVQPTVLSGTVSDPSGQLVASDSVIVFPKDSAPLDNPGRWTRWIKPDPGGHFAIRDLPEGDFYVVAVRDVDDALWQTPAYLEALRSQATPVRLAAGRVVTVALSVRALR